MKHNKVTYHIAGMHCASCEVLIEKTLLEIEGIEGVTATTATEEVSISTRENFNLTPEKISAFLKKKGLQEYTCYATKKDAPKPRWFTPRGGAGEGIDVNWSYIYMTIGPYIIVLALYIIMKIFGFEKFIQGFSITETTSIGAMFILGVIASISSCAALIGGVIVSLDSSWKKHSDHAVRIKKHIQFHSSRIIGFTIFGGLLGLLGDAIQIGPSISAVLVLVVSLIMILVSLQLLGFTFVSKVIPRAPSDMISNISNGKKHGAAYIGAGTILLPCGFTLVAQSSAILSGSFFHGALLLGVFSLGTLPALAGISFLGTRSISVSRVSTEIVTKVIAILIVVLSLYTINSQFTVLALPNISDIMQTAEHENRTAVEIINGAQEVRIAAKGFSYKAVSSMVVSSDKPVRLIVDNKGVVGCAAYVSVFGHSNDFTALVPGENVIELGLLSKGTYKISCSMGMVTPVNLVVE